MLHYRERLWPSVWVFVATALVIPASLLVFLPINPFAGVIVAIVLYGAIVLLLLATTPTVEVSDGILRAGRARLPREVVSGVTAFRDEEARAERGVRLDARAWMLVRPWALGVVRVELDDPEDPVPYWLVASRRPEELAAALSR